MLKCYQKHAHTTCIYELSTWSKTWWIKLRVRNIIRDFRYGKPDECHVTIFIIKCVTIFRRENYAFSRCAFSNHFEIDWHSIFHVIHVNFISFTVKPAFNTSSAQNLRQFRRKNCGKRFYQFYRKFKYIRTLTGKRYFVLLEKFPLKNKSSLIIWATFASVLI